MEMASTTILVKNSVHDRNGPWHNIAANPSNHMLCFPPHKSNDEPSYQSSGELLYPGPVLFGLTQRSPPPDDDVVSQYDPSLCNAGRDNDVLKAIL